MATYTDLQNKVKETINVGYKDRITTQPVKMYNEQNEYWGTFKGTVAVDDVAVDGGKIKNVEIYDSALCGKVILPGGTDLAKIGYAISDLSGTVENIIDTTVPAIYSTISEVNSNLTNEIVTRKSEITRVEGIISATDVRINDKISALDDKLTTQDHIISVELANRISCERSERIESDVILDNAIKANTTLINAESTERAGADAVINDRIDEEVQNSIDRDDALCARLIEHEDKTKAAFNLEHAQMLSTVSHDRHYELYGLADELKNSYPYQLHDYTVNVLKTTINDGIVVSENNIDVGTYNVKDGKTYFHVNSPLIDKDLEIALIPDSSFVFTGSETQRTGRPTYNSYTIRLDDSVDPTSFILNQTTSSYYEIHWSGDQIIGTITDYLMNSDNSEFISGKISIYPAGVPELTPFSCEKLPFSQENPLIQIPGTTEEILFQLSDNYSFQLRKGVHTTYYCPISSDSVSPVEFAEILSGNAIVEGSNISEMIVDIKSPAIASKISLNTDNGFTNIYQPDRILSAKVTDLSAEFELINRQAYFNYNVYLSDDAEYVGRRVAKMVPGKVNTELSSKDYTTISAILDNFDIADKFKGEYVLYDDPTTVVKVWKAKKIFEDEATTYEHVSWIYVEFDGLHLNVNTWNAENGTTAFRSFNVKQTMDGYANADALTTIYKSTLTPVTEFSQTRKLATYTYDVPASLIIYHPEETHKQFKLTVDKSRSGKLNFEIPAKKTGYVDISREFMLTLNVVSTETSLDSYICDFGSDITIFADKSKQLSVAPGRWVTYQFNEVAQNKFLVTDLNDIKEYEKLRDLSAKLDAEIELRDVQYDQLSTAISNNISSIEDLYKQIKGGLVYQDALSLDVVIEHLPDANTFRGLFAQNIKNATGSTNYEEGLSVKLRNGFYWIATSRNQIEKYYFDGAEVRHGDLVIIKENTTVRDITAEKVSIIDIMDKDAVHEDRLCQVSNWLSNDYYSQVQQLISGDNTISGNNTILGETLFKGGVRAISADLSVESVKKLYVNNPNQIGLKVTGNSYMNGLTADSISTTILSASAERIYIDDAKNSTLKALSIDLQNQISTNKQNLKSISTDIYKNVDSGDLASRGLSGKVEFLLSSDKSSMCYGKTLKSIPTPLNPDDQYTYLLSDFLIANGIKSFLKTGFMFRLSSEQKFYPKHDPMKVAVSAFVFGENDYFIVNKDIAVSNITSTDIDVIYDAAHEAVGISSDLSALRLSVDQLSNYIDKLEISANSISSKVNSLCIEISNDITARYNSICSEISTTNENLNALSSYSHLSLELSVSQISSRINTLCTEISNDLTAKYSELTGKCEYLSSELSDYHNTLSGIDRKKHSTGDIVTDNLMLTDMKDITEGTLHDKYYLQVLSGTLVLVPIK